MNDLLDELDKKNEKALPHHELTRTILGFGLLVNFRHRKLEYQRLHQPEENVEQALPF